MKKTILLIHGKKGSGKDYITSLITSWHRRKFKRVAFADNLKYYISIVTGLSINEFDYLKDNKLTFDISVQDFNTKVIDAFQVAIMKYNLCNIHQKAILDELDKLTYEINNDILTFKARRFIQEFGTIFKRLFNDPYIWVLFCSNEISEISNNIVISDFRYPAEFEKLKEVFINDNIITIKVIGKNYYEKDEFDNDSSETALNDFQFDYHFNNTIWDDRILLAQVNGLINEIKSKY